MEVIVVKNIICFTWKEEMCPEVYNIRREWECTSMTKEEFEKAYPGVMVLYVFPAEEVK